jgi:hypothetical protein
VDHLAEQLVGARHVRLQVEELALAVEDGGVHLLQPRPGGVDARRHVAHHVAALLLLAPDALQHRLVVHRAAHPIRVWRVLVVGQEDVDVVLVVLAHVDLALIV